MENTLLSISIIKRFNMIDTKINVDFIMEEYSILKYKWRSVKAPTITPNYEIRYSCYVPVKSDPVGRFIERKLDTDKEVETLYIDLMRVANSFTQEEKIFFIDKYFNNRSDQLIAEKLNRCRNGISHIKNSCILKLALAFNEEVRIK